MAAVELLETFELEEAPSHLRLVRVDPNPRAFREGPSLAQRRRVCARVRQRRQRLGATLVLVGALTVLALPGHVFGATTGAGLSTDLADSSVLASGMNYVVQPGDTITSIARDMNPTDPQVARSMLVSELGSAVIVPGEHVLIP
jgi:predicted permease